MQASVDSQIIHIHGIKHSLTSEMTGKVEYQQENNNQRNRGYFNCCLLTTTMSYQGKQAKGKIVPNDNLALTKQCSRPPYFPSCHTIKHFKAAP